MPVSVETTRIAQLACLTLERSPPASLEDDTDLARDLLAFYPDARDRCLEAGDWSFASTLVYLPEVSDLPDGYAADSDLPYLYAVPPDARRLLEVGTGLHRWRRDGVGIRADAPAPLRLRYTAAEPAESQWPAEFRTAVAMALAVLLAPRWLQTASKADNIERRAAQALKQAMRNHAADASQARYDGLTDAGDWVQEARR